LVTQVVITQVRRDIVLAVLRLVDLHGLAETKRKRSETNENESMSRHWNGPLLSLCCEKGSRSDETSSKRKGGRRE
jgi:hypothetical protein